MTLNDPRHPAWAFARWFSTLVFVLVILALNASKFDATEVRAWIEIALGYLAIQGGHRVLKKRAWKNGLGTSNGG